MKLVRIKNLIKHRIKINPTQMLVIGFFTIILLGGFLLMLPISTRDGIWTHPIKALFTATSATCVTGLVTFDTYTYWSGFGQIVILCMIQVGGLGFMTMATLLSFLLRRKIKLQERLVMMESVQSINMTGIVRMTKHILIGTLMFEGLGAIILSIRFSADYGFIDGIKKGIFHSVSAFCNAGFDLMGQTKEFSSLTAYNNDFVVNFVIMALIVIGGLGFFVWEDIFNAKSFKELRLYSKLVLFFTIGLIGGGAILFYIFEYANPDTLGALTPAGKIYAAFFQSVSPRTAGFNTIDLAAMTPSSKILTGILMFIGGASGSTAGGIKIVTAGVLMVAVVSVARGKTQFNLSNRRVSSETVLRALAIAVIAAVMIVVCSMIMLNAEKGTSVMAIFFECISAFATVGLSLGITPGLSNISLIVLMILMFFGRVGILTIAIALATKMSNQTNKIKYPEAKILIG